MSSPLSAALRILWRGDTLLRTNRENSERALYDNLTVEPEYLSLGMDMLELLCMNIFMILNKTLKRTWLNTGHLEAL